MVHSDAALSKLLFYMRRSRKATKQAQLQKKKNARSLPRFPQFPTPITCDPLYNHSSLPIQLVFSSLAGRPYRSFSTLLGEICALVGSSTTLPSFIPEEIADELNSQLRKE